MNDQRSQRSVETAGGKWQLLGARLPNIDTGKPRAHRGDK
jgi:hypothetical protein